MKAFLKKACTCLLLHSNFSVIVLTVALRLKKIAKDAIRTEKSQQLPYVFHAFLRVGVIAFHKI